MGSALRYCIPQMIGRKMNEFWELMKPLIDFKYEVMGLGCLSRYSLCSMRMNTFYERAFLLISL